MISFEPSVLSEILPGAEPHPKRIHPLQAVFVNQFLLPLSIGEESHEKGVFEIADTKPFYGFFGTFGGFPTFCPGFSNGTTDMATVESILKN